MDQDLLRLAIEGLEALRGPQADAQRALEIAERLLGPERVARIVSAGNAPSGRDFRDRLVALLDEADLGADETWGWVRRVPDPVDRMFALLASIRRIARRDGPSAAEPLVEHLGEIQVGRMNDTRALGWRELLALHAERGDADAFVATLAKCETAKERHVIESAKHVLVRAYAARDGFDAAARLCGGKAFGPRYLKTALVASAKRESYPSMKALLERRADLPLEPGDRERALVAAFAAQAPELASADFDAVFALATELDPKIKAGDLRLRDALLMDLGLACRDAKLVERCRKAANGAAKRELAARLEQLRAG